MCCERDWFNGVSQLLSPTARAVASRPVLEEQVRSTSWLQRCTCPLEGQTTGMEGGTLVSATRYPCSVRLSNTGRRACPWPPVVKRQDLAFCGNIVSYLEDSLAQSFMGVPSPQLQGLRKGPFCLKSVSWGT